MFFVRIFVGFSFSDEDELLNILSPRQELDFTEKLWEVLKVGVQFF